MRAAIVPSVNSKWELREVPTPEPGPGQVLIKIHASGLCYTDVHQTRGELPARFRARSVMSRWARSWASGRV
jgi:D-arabinose 1-dehydrogenase-like Zn-dependent alcohol dehydrogenase